MAYEGARAVTGPLLATLGASGLVVGVVVGAGEAAALLLRLVSGPLADRTGRHWTLALVGYALTAVCVPLLAITPALGAAGRGVAAALVLAERAGKAVRSPAKSALLEQAATGTGLGRGFAVHKALDQVGAFSGPLLVAAAVALTGVLWPGLALLAVPGAAAVVVQGSTVKALVADLVPAGRRASAYGVFAAVQGGAALVGGVLAGMLHKQSLTALVLVLVACQGLAATLLALTARPPLR